jgi:NADPH:quinone reductase-like Zn-dependent oxidoreductase
LYAGIRYPIILGSDGAGIVHKIGSAVAENWLGKEVLLNPSQDWGENPKVQSKDYHILGLPHDGCFAEMVVVKEKYLHIKPSFLSFEEAAAFPLAGLTAFRSVFSKGELVRGEKLLITGIGGGVALFALSWALAIGAEVWVTSSSEEKIQKAIDLGAKGGARYTEDAWAKKLAQRAGGFDLIIDSAGGEGFKDLIDLANMGGRIVFFGGTKGAFTVMPQKVFWKQLSILGSTMGNESEFAAMMELIETHRIRPVIDSVFSLSEGSAAFDRMDNGTQFGKIILQP